MDKTFDLCVDLLIYWADILGMTYNELNIYLFVIIHPIITLLFLYQYMRYRVKFKASKSCLRVKLVE